MYSACEVPMSAAIPVVLVPGLNCSARLYAAQVPALWHCGPVQIADHTRDDSMEAIAARILAAAPPRFALAGLSMGGYIALTMTRLAPDRIIRLALLDTSARAETPEQTARRRPQIALAEEGRFDEVPPLQFPIFVHRDRQNDQVLREEVRRMAEETGAAAFLRQQTAIIARADARAHLAAIRCPTMVLVGDGDILTPPALSQEMTAGIPGARLVVIPACGHLSTIERPDAVNRALVDWLSDG
jgi:pimeloyl-ACP methyl ester carboxylesterase